jgi:DNA helicase HerA-like ATPase
MNRETLCIVGRTGSGKTFAAKTMVEQDLAGGRRVCVVDPTGAWWGLRLDFTGRSALYDVVIFGGEHADVPITPDQGEAIADVVAQGQVTQCVIDVSEMSNGEQKRPSWRSGP